LNASEIHQLIENMQSSQHYSRSLRAARSRTASCIYDKRVPISQHSTIPYWGEKLSLANSFKISA
jgi:hypothetical protein